MSEHTPTPWRVDSYSDDIYSDNVPKGTMRVADIRGWGYLTGKGAGALGLSDDEAMAIQKANAAIIVKAVNSHEALVKALTDLLDACESIGTFRNGVEHNGIDEGNVYVAGLIDQARDALTLVGKSEQSP